MACDIKSHRLWRDGKAVAYRRSPNVGGEMTPRAIVLHDTAADLGEGWKARDVIADVAGLRAERVALTAARHRRAAGACGPGQGDHRRLG